MGTTQFYTGSSVIFRNPGNGNLTEDARCWQAAPSPSTDVDVVVLGSRAACRFGSWRRDDRAAAARATELA